MLKETRKDTVTVKRVKRIDSPEEIQELWELYDDAFRKVNEESPCRQSYTEEEFQETLQDEDIEKSILIDRFGKILGIGLTTNNLDKVPWISQAFYQKYFPDHFRNRSIYYIKGLVVSSKRQKRTMIGSILLSHMIDTFPQESIGCFDYSERMNENMPEFVQRVGKERACAGRLLDKQVYFIFEKGSNI